MRVVPVVLSSLLSVGLSLGCSRVQSWTYENGFGVGSDPPASIVATVFEGAECGPSCNPPGARVDCFTAPGDQAGRSPEGMSDGQEYCFVVTALDEAGIPYAVGCDSVMVGSGDPVRVILSSADSVGLPAGCGPEVMFDAGAPTDAGPPPDAGDPPDSGGVVPDAGPPPLPDGTRVQVVFETHGPGQVRLINLNTGQLVPPTSPAFDGYQVGYNTFVSRQLRLDLTPDPGAALLSLEGVSCVPDPNCDFRVDRPMEILIQFGVP